ncbi:hypothetical protein [Marivita sp. S2033]|uniref:hypothetical protein n=1 Tax=Marivita sp. S2033 TaxID=3373187 RepID=UPI003982079F
MRPETKALAARFALLSPRDQLAWVKQQLVEAYSGHPPNSLEAIQKAIRGSGRIAALGHAVGAFGKNDHTSPVQFIKYLENRVRETEIPDTNKSAGGSNEEAMIQSPKNHQHDTPNHKG